MVANSIKFQVIFLDLKKNQNLPLEINGDVIASSEEVKLLGVTIGLFPNHATGARDRNAPRQQRSRSTI